MIYFKPSCNSFSGVDIKDFVGPMQAAYVELQIYYQQIPQPQVELNTVEKGIMVAENKKSFIYNTNDIA